MKGFSLASVLCQTHLQPFLEMDIARPGLAVNTVEQRSALKCFYTSWRKMSRFVAPFSATTLRNLWRRTIEVEKTVIF
jgi:hypothetical protein